MATVLLVIHLMIAAALCGVVLLQRPISSLLVWAGVIMFVGIVLFCGSLYANALTGQRGWGMVAPFGGTAFIVAWVLVAVAASRT